MLNQTEITRMEFLRERLNHKHYSKYEPELNTLLDKFNQNPTLYWLNHCACWFAFSEPTMFIQSQLGGYFAKVRTGEHIFSHVQGGFKMPDFTQPGNKLCM